MTSTYASTGKKRALRQMFTLLLAFSLVLPMLCALAPEAEAASAMQPYCETLGSWGVMRGNNGNFYPDRLITRAEFVTLVNRAFGYTELGPNPYSDVPDDAWYAEDIRIGRQAGYFNGTSATTAEPLSYLTREQAAVLIGRNMRLQGKPGLPMGFSDAQSIGQYSRAFVQEASNLGIIQGYTDGSFRPKNNITRGQVACYLVRALGNLITTPGEKTLGNVVGNVTINSSGVTLKDTTIAGDLYLTGGVGLGSVQLENVNVLGRIIVCGSGESHAGSDSVVLRNVNANAMEVDSMAGKFVTIRADGNTTIDTTELRTSAYIADLTDDEFGLKNIEISGAPITQLAGNVKNVTALSPAAQLTLAQGTAASVTMDESSIGSNLNIAGGASIKELNLDVSTNVTGTGDITAANINAAGVNVSVLPDTITVRPGLSANVSGQAMDTVAAAESSLEPKILSGYPLARNVTPNGATAVFRGNKRGTIYWAVTALTDGTVSANDVVSPPSYATKILKSGTIPAPTSQTDVTAAISGLTSNGSYYISAVLVDARGQRSPLKIAAFTTPDDTVPNFASGYPYISQVTNTSAQVAVMPTKSCQLYYALLPKSSTAPTPANFKANSVTGNLGFGTLELTKNTPKLFNVNRGALKELETYDLYLWLTDFNGAKSSAVKKLTFTTVDKTPPVLEHLDITGVKATAIDATFAINEPGTLYWAVVKAGEPYPKPTAGATVAPALTDLAAKMYVESGMNSVKYGNAKASKASTDTKFTISGLAAETAYDLYYIVKDNSGNYSEAVKKLTVNTLDNKAPTVDLEFTKFNTDNASFPLANTDIRIVFSEGVQGIAEDGHYYNFLETYEAMKAASGTTKTDLQNALASALSNSIHLYNASNRQPVDVRSASDQPKDWVVDYRFATVTMEDGKMIITLPTRANREESALNLASGASYYFVFNNIADTSTAANKMGQTQKGPFTTVFAQVNLTDAAISAMDTADMSQLPAGTIPRLDVSFQVQPLSTKTAPADMCWDLQIWNDVPIYYNLFVRSRDEDSDTWEPWQQIGGNHESSTKTPTYTSQSLKELSGGHMTYDPLSSLDDTKVYQYGIQCTTVNGNSVYEQWNVPVNFKVSVVAGSNNNIGVLYSGLAEDSWKKAISDGIVSSIGLSSGYGQKEKDRLLLTKPFSDQVYPFLKDGSPLITEVTSSNMTFKVTLNQPGTVYYAIVPEDKLSLTTTSGAPIPYATIPTSGSDSSIQPMNPTPANPQKQEPALSLDNMTVVNEYPVTARDDTAIKVGEVACSVGAKNVTVNDLQPETKYYLLMVTMAPSGKKYSSVYYFRFETTPVETPHIRLGLSGDSGASFSVPDMPANVDWALIELSSRPSFLNTILRDDITYLDAMLTTVNQVTQESLFDKEADATAKETVMKYIRTTSTGTGDRALEYGNLAVSAGVPESANFTQMKAGPEYVLLAVARHAKADSNSDISYFGFKALKGLTKKNLDPPNLKYDPYTSDGTEYRYLKISSLKAKDKSGNDVITLIGAKPEQLASYRYSGTITLSFVAGTSNSAPATILKYAEVQGASYQSVWQVGKNYATSDDAISILKLMEVTSPSAKLAVPSDTTGGRSSFLIRFEDFENGDSIIFPTSGNLYTADGGRSDNSITLTFQAPFLNGSVPNVQAAFIIS